MNMVKYATSTVNIIVIGSELEKNASLLDNEIVKEYYDTVNTCVVMMNTYSLDYRLIMTLIL